MAGSNRSSDQWLVPAFLIAGAVFLGLVAWLIVNATQDEPDDVGLVRQLELYTSCLNDHGANVPQIETRGDGGFAIIVPGAMLDHDPDPAELGEALRECRPLAPNPLQAFFGGEDLDLRMLFGVLESGFATDEVGRGGFGRSGLPRPADIDVLCDRLAHGQIDDFLVSETLEAVCDRARG